ncbi:tetraspanin Tsp3 [Metarhizium album ARSEF 1941]|uniref:Tetraspanin Tsp3 n=1 Tax=Metarhizium album (strain ARSEF 1941) TaxID=1081103 RepID=A0A0B2WXL0_METAS|nr:tetraspanin Tsp3 [Metarhizium album ARSEF 1941]KHN98304.1 tetraspanin Tsp3 [Metarhizium album ARSEF 1941]
MFNPGIAYMLVCVVLFAVAVVIHYHTIHLSLPISSAITILSILLPITAFLNAYIYPNLLRSSHTFTSGDIFTRLAPIGLQGLQAITTAVLATLLLGGVVPSPALEFLIDYGWDKLYQAKNADCIVLIQDTYNCCGLNSVDDRAYPFHNVPGGTCAEIHGRTKACRQPWTGALRAASGIDFGVVAVVGLMQMIGLLIMRERTAWWTALRTEDWKPFSETDDESSRRLPTVAEESEESSEQGEPAQAGYGAIQMPVAEPSSSPGEANHRNND